MIDADHFKRINDTAGHQAGDLVLTQIVQKAKAHLRSIDLLARLGGEEFCLMLPGTSREEALVIAERVRATIADTEIDTGAGPIRVTVSAGIASLSDATSCVNDLLAAADKALYAAKAAGRNRVELG